MLPISYETAVSRALRLRCPRCGKGRLFRNWLIMPPKCLDCGLRYERAPGYFLGSAYINYGFVALTLTAMYMGLHFGAGISNQVLAGPLIAYSIIVPLILFRYARAWWLAMDCYFDPASFAEAEDYMVRGEKLQSPGTTAEAEGEAGSVSSPGD
jgi:uncharacterized protein (DUF983 family)